jgi:hypothetical protein
LWIDATYVKVRQNGRIVSVAVIVAVGVNSDGRREVLGMDIGPSEAETFWTAFLRKLARRRLRGVKLVVSDEFEALFPGCTTRRRRDVRFSLGRRGGCRRSFFYSHRETSLRQRPLAIVLAFPLHPFLTALKLATRRVISSRSEPAEDPVTGSSRAGRADSAIARSIIFSGTPGLTFALSIASTWAIVSSIKAASSACHVIEISPTLNLRPCQRGGQTGTLIGRRPDCG